MTVQAKIVNVIVNQRWTKVGPNLVPKLKNVSNMGQNGLKVKIAEIQSPVILITSNLDI